MPQHPDKPVVETTIEARSGETGPNVSFVLLFGIGGAIIALTTILWYFGNEGVPFLG